MNGIQWRKISDSEHCTFIVQFFLHALLFMPSLKKFCTNSGSVFWGLCLGCARDLCREATRGMCALSLCLNHCLDPVF